jgi:hypothetical protein
MIQYLDDHTERVFAELLYGQLYAAKDGAIELDDLIWGLRIPRNFEKIKVILGDSRLTEVIEVLDDLSALQELHQKAYEERIDELLGIVFEVLRHSPCKQAGYIYICECE